jgi:integrase
MDLDGFQTWLKRRGRSETTAKHYGDQLRLAMGHEDGLHGRLVDEELSPNTRRLALSAAKAYAKFAKDAELDAELSDIRLPPPERVVPKRPLPPDQWKDLIDHIETTGDLTNLEAGALSMLCRRGFRVGAIVSLNRRDVENALKTGTLVFLTKGRRLQYGVQPIRQACKRMLKDDWQLVARGLMPSSPDGPQLMRAARDRINRLLREQAQAALIDDRDVYAHRLRHTCATEFYQATKDIAALKQYMQWSTIDIAARYVGEMDRTELDKIAEELLK